MAGDIASRLKPKSQAEARLYKTKLATQLPRAPLPRRRSSLAQTGVRATKARKHQRLRCLGRERAAAAAITRRIGIDENKTLAHERLFVIERGSVQVQQALRIHEYASAEL